MKEAQFRILDVLARNLGSPMSISSITDAVRRDYGSAHYANIHAELDEMAGDKVRLEKVGRSSLVTLNAENLLLADYMAEVELIRKCRFLIRHQPLQLLAHRMGADIRGMCTRAVVAVNPEQNARSNRLELLILSKPGRARKEAHAAGEALKAHAGRTKIDCMVMGISEFARRLRSAEANPAREALSDMMVLFHPQAFWTDMAEYLKGRVQIKAAPHTTPSKISRQDLAYNMSRLGADHGGKIIQGGPVCVEYVVISILQNKDRDGMELIPVLLAKNKADYDMLVFLASKYRVLKPLYHILEQLDKIKASPGLHGIVKELGGINGIRRQQMVKLSQKGVEKKLREYGAL